MPEQGDVLLSRIRVDKIYTLAQAIVVQNFGAVKATTLERIRIMLQALVAAKQE